MQRVWIILIITCVMKCSFLCFCFSHDYSYISILWIHNCSGSGINQCHIYWSRDKITTILHIISKSLFFKWPKITAFVPKGAVDYKWKLVQAMAWHQAHTEPLPESGVIQLNGAYMRLSDWMSWLLHRIGKIIGNFFMSPQRFCAKCGEKRCCLSTLHHHSWKWAILPVRLGRV